jgi:hypothetical protein
MRLGLDGRTVTIGVFAVVLAVVLGAVAGASAGAGAGALAAVAGLVPPAVLAVAVERRQRTIAQQRSRQEVLRRFAPPEPTGHSPVLAEWCPVRVNVPCRSSHSSAASAASISACSMSSAFLSSSAALPSSPRSLACLADTR